VNLKGGGLGVLGNEQPEWLERDLKRLRSSTPIVVFAHIPLWSVYPEWGWGTDDSARAVVSEAIRFSRWCGSRDAADHAATNPHHTSFADG
jgi:hypothetical protein